MRMSRRELSGLVPALAALGVAPSQAPAAPPRVRLSTSRVFHHAAIPYSGDATKKGRRFFIGETRGGFNLETHETVLGVGVETHAPHRHLHEEIIVVTEGTVETYVDGHTEVVEAGSVILFASNQLHSARNAGKVPCRYYVIELRGDEA